MKILMVNKFLYPNGGSETYMFKLGEYLEKHGHELQYFGMADKSNCVGNKVKAYTSNMDFHNASKMEKLTYPLKTIYSTEARKQIRKVLDDFKPDVCHLNNFNYQLTPSIILEIVKWRDAEKKECKIIYTAHDYQLICPNHLMYNHKTGKVCEQCIEKSYFACSKNKCIHGSFAKSMIGVLEHFFWDILGVYKKIDSIICPSNFIKEKLDTSQILKNKTKVIHNFISDMSEVSDTKSKIELPNKYVLYFGRYSKEKGIETLLNVCEKLSYIQFIFVGNGPLKERISEYKNVIDLGFRSGSELKEIIRHAEFTICPSEWYEVFGLSIGESMSLGTPVIGADVGGISEQITDGVDGRLFETLNVNELENLVNELWNNPQEVKKYSIEALKKERNNLEKYFDALRLVYF